MIDLSSVVFLPPIAIAVIIIFYILIKNWELTKKFFCDWNCFASFCKSVWFIKRRINPAMKQSFQRAEEEPICMAYDGFIPLIYRFNPKAEEITIKLKEGFAEAIIPSMDLLTIAKALHKHIRDNLSHSSIAEDVEKLQKALDMAVLTLLLEKTGMDGSFNVALKRIFAQCCDDDELNRLYQASLTINRELKIKRALTWLNKRLLRILLMEMYRLETRTNLGMVV